MHNNKKTKMKKMNKGKKVCIYHIFIVTSQRKSQPMKARERSDRSECSFTSTSSHRELRSQTSQSISSSNVIILVSSRRYFVSHRWKTAASLLRPFLQSWCFTSCGGSGFVRTGCTMATLPATVFEL